MLKILNVFFYVFYMLILFVLGTLKKTRNSKKIYRIFIVLMLTFFFLKELGLDYEAYKNLYYDLNPSEKYRLFKEYVEPVPYTMMLLLRKLNLSHRYFFLFIGGLTLLLNSYLIKRKKNNILLNLFFLLYIYFFSAFSDAIRQNLAAAFLLVALYLYSKKRKVVGVITLLLSFFSHYSTIMIIPIFVVKKMKWNIKKYFFLVIITIIGSFFIRFTINYLASFNENNMIVMKLNYYLIYGEKEYNYLNQLHFILLYAIVILEILGIIILNFIFIKKQSKLGKFEKNILQISIISSIISILFLFLGAKVIAFRIGLTFSYGLYLLISDNYLNKREKNFIFIFYTIYNLCVLFYYSGIHDPMSPFSLV